MSPRHRERVAVLASTVPVTIHTFHRELIRQLTGEGYQVVVVSSPEPELGLLAGLAGVRTVPIPMRRAISPTADARALRAWLRLLRRERPALVVATTPKASLLGMLAARATRVPRRVYYLGGLRLEGARGLNRRILRATERLTTSCADVVVVNSPSLAGAVLAHRVTRTGKLRTIQPASSHGVDAEHFAPREADSGLRDGLGLLPGMPVVGFIGRVTADKGLDALVSALALLRERGREVQLLVLGSQVERDSQTWVPRLLEHARVVLAGHVDDIRPYVALMDVHVLPSRREGFPNVVLETAAMRVPTVTTRATGAVDSVVDGETGLLVEVDDAAGLAEAVDSLLADPDRLVRMGDAARERVVRDFQPRAVVASLVGHIMGGAPAG